MSKNVVLIHGAFCGGWCFGDIMPVFAARGWACQAPDLPFHVPGPARPPDPRWRRRASPTTRATWRRSWRAFRCAAVLVGHSMGGLVAQQLAAQGLARALVLLAPAARWGILPSSEAELALAKGLMQASPFWNKALNPSFDVAKGDSLAGLAPEAQRRMFDHVQRPVRPAPCSSCSSGCSTSSAAPAVDAGKVRCPVLVVVGVAGPGHFGVAGRKLRSFTRARTFARGRRPGAFPHHGRGLAEFARRCADWMADVSDCGAASPR